MGKPVTPEELHAFAREIAVVIDMLQSELGKQKISMKLVRWNDIIQTAFDFYPSDPKWGVVECLRSCIPDDPIYDGKRTLPVILNADYKWMIAA